MYQLPKLAKVPGLVHGFSTREEGNQGFGFADGKGRVIMNRGRFLKKLHGSSHITSGAAMVPFRPGYEETIVAIGTEVAGHGMMAPNSGPFCEAMITSLPQRNANPLADLYLFSEPAEDKPLLCPKTIYLFLAVADCIPIILYDPVERVLALVHGGRAATAARTSHRTLTIMAKELKVNPADVLVGLGPGIKTYETDLFAANAEQLTALGVREGNIEISKIDTFADVRFASHRRSRATGEPEWRHAAVVGMVPVE